MTTKKNKEQFETWLITSVVGNSSSNIFSCYNFNSFPFEMQIGVYLAFYNSLGYDIYPDACSCHVPSLYTFIIKNNSTEKCYYSHEYFISDFKNPIEAYRAAFKKVDEIINNKP